MGSKCNATGDAKPSVILVKPTVDHFGASLIEGLEDAVVVTDSALAVLAWNGVMERLTGTRRATAIGRPATDLLAFLHDSDVSAHLKNALDGEESCPGEVAYMIGEREGW